MRSFVTSLALVGALLTAPASAQTAGVPLQVRTGEVYTVSVEQTQTTDVAGQNVEATLAHVYALHIVDAENRVWRYMPASMSYAMPTGFGFEEEAAAFDWTVINQAVSAALRVGTDVGFECRVDEYGRCLEMANWPLWRDRLENVVLMADAFARLIPASAATGDEVPVAIEPIAPGRKSDEEGMVEAATPAVDWATLRGPVLRGIASLLDNVDGRDAGASLAMIETPAFLQGRTLTRREAVPVAVDLEMPFGAPPLRYVGTMRLERINQRDNTATIVRQVSLDEASARATVLAMSQFLTANLVQPVAAASGDPDGAASLSAVIEPIVSAIGLRYEETTTGIVDLTTGMARETTTAYTFTVMPPGGADGGAPVEIQGRTVIRITPGAPNVQRLPRE